MARLFDVFHAQCNAEANGVKPWSYFAFTPALLAKSNATTSNLPKSAATCKGVRPLFSLAFTSALLASWQSHDICFVRVRGPVPSFTGEEISEIIGTVVFFQYINRIVTVLLDDTPLPFSQPWLGGLC